MKVREFRQVLVDVKYNGNTDNQQNRVEISAYKLIDDITVHSLDIAEWVQFLQWSQSVPRQLTQPYNYWHQQCDETSPLTANVPCCMF